MDESLADQDDSSCLPTDEQRQQSLEQSRFSTAAGLVGEPDLDLVDAFRAMSTNGGAHVASFEVVDSDEVASWFITCVPLEAVPQALDLRAEQVAGGAGLDEGGPAVGQIRGACRLIPPS